MKLPYNGIKMRYNIPTSGTPLGSIYSPGHFILPILPWAILYSPGPFHTPHRGVYFFVAMNELGKLIMSSFHEVATFGSCGEQFYE